MVYMIKDPGGKPIILTKYFKDGRVDTVAKNGSAPYTTNLRMVYIKNGNTLGYSKLDGINRLLIPLTEPNYPTLSIDTRLICLVDKLSDSAYQLLKYDTSGNKTVLYQTKSEIKSLAFTSDGQKIVFSEKTTPNSANIFIINVNGGTPKKITKPVADFFDDYCTVTNGTIYFVRNRIIDSTLSSEIFSSDFNGSNVTQLTNFTNDWSAPSFFIKDLRKIAWGIDSSKLICVSNYNNAKSDIFLYKIGGDLSRMTETDVEKSYPNMIPTFVKEQ